MDKTQALLLPGIWGPPQPLLPQENSLCPSPAEWFAISWAIPIFLAVLVHVTLWLTRTLPSTALSLPALVEISVVLQSSAQVQLLFQALSDVRTGWNRWYSSLARGLYFILPWTTEHSLNVHPPSTRLQATEDRDHLWLSSATPLRPSHMGKLVKYKFNWF